MARRPTEIPIGRGVRVGILGLGQVYDLCVTGYQGNPDAEIVALCDVEPGRVDERAGDWPNTERFVDIEDFLQADMDWRRWNLPELEFPSNWSDGRLQEPSIWPR